MREVRRSWRAAAAHPFRADFRDDDDLLDERLRLLPSVSPACRRCLLTVAAAMRFAVAVLRPRFFADALIFSY